MSRFIDSLGLRAGLIAAVLLTFGVSLAADWVVPSAEARGFRRSRFRSSSRSWRRSSRSYRSRRSSRSSSRRARRRPSYRKRTTTRTRRTTRRRTYSNYNTGSTGRRMRRMARNQRRINRRYRSSRSLSTTARWDRYQRAQSRGLVFATTALAVAHYLRVTRPEQYPVQFNTRPTTHPSYLPSSALHKGKSYPVVWSASARRYMLKVGDTLVPYEPLKDTVFIQRGMEQAGYFIGTRPPRPRVRSRVSGAASLLGVIFLLLIIVALAVIVWRLKKRFSSGGAQPNRRGRGVVKAPGPPRQHDPDHSDYWLQVEVGDMLSVNDMQAWTDMLKAANASTYGLDFRVRSALRMNDMAGLWHAALYGIDQLSAQPGDQPLWLLAWRERGAVHLSVYYTPQGVQLGTRADMLDRGDTWLFQEPQQNDWMPNTLTYQPEIHHTGVNDQGGEVVQVFHAAPQQVSIGLATAYPGARSMRSVQVVRWRCPEAEHNPLMLVVEFGAMERVEGGQLQLLLGAEVRPDEVDVTPMGEAA